MLYLAPIRFALMIGRKSFKSGVGIRDIRQRTSRSSRLKRFNKRVFHKCLNSRTFYQKNKQQDTIVTDVKENKSCNDYAYNELVCNNELPTRAHRRSAKDELFSYMEHKIKSDPRVILWDFISDTKDSINPAIIKTRDICLEHLQKKMTYVKS